MKQKIITKLNFAINIVYDKYYFQHMTSELLPNVVIKLKTPWKYFWYHFNTGNRNFFWHGKGVFDWFIRKPHLHVQVVMFWVNTRNSSHFAREPRKCNIFRQKGYPPRWMNLQESTFGVIIELHIVCKVELAIMATRKQAKENMCIAIYIYIYIYIYIIISQ